MALVREDPEKPGLYPLRIAAGGQRPVRPDERLLHGIGGLIRVPYQGRGVSRKLDAVAPDQHLEQARFAVENAPDDLAVRQAVVFTQETSLPSEP